MNRTIRAVVWGLVVGGVLSLACSSVTNPPEPPNGGTGGGSTNSDGGADAGDAGGGGGGGAGGGSGGGGGGGNVVVLPCAYDGGDTPTYTATSSNAGNINRIQIQRATTTDQPQCVRIVLVQNDGGVVFGDGGLSVPAGWQLNNSTLRDRACGSGGTNGIEPAQNVVGTVTFSGGGNPFPTTLTINAVVQAASGSTLPAESCVDRVNLTVQ